MLAKFAEMFIEFFSTAILTTSASFVSEFHQTVFQFFTIIRPISKSEDPFPAYCLKVKRPFFVQVVSTQINS